MICLIASGHLLARIASAEEVGAGIHHRLALVAGALMVEVPERLREEQRADHEDERGGELGGEHHLGDATAARGAGRTDGAEHVVGVDA